MAVVHLETLTIADRETQRAAMATLTVRLVAEFAEPRRVR